MQIIGFHKDIRNYTDFITKLERKRKREKGERGENLHSIFVILMFI